MALGATGCISGLANAVPDLLVRIFESVKAGAPQRAAKAIERVSIIGTLAERLEFPLNIAAIMEARGLPVGHPKSLVSPSTKARYRELTAACEKSFRAWKLI
jgi:dihydrodipicolinate synthase/N-acetylneuraminate lyase